MSKGWLPAGPIRRGARGRRKESFYASVLPLVPALIAFIVVSLLTQKSKPSAKAAQD